MEKYVKKANDILKEIKTLEPAPTLPENMWWLRLPKGVDGNGAAIRFVPSPPTKEVKGTPTFDEETGKWVPPGTWMFMHVFNMYFYEMQMLGCDRRMEEIDKKYKPEMDALLAEIRKIKFEMVKIYTNHALSVSDNSDIIDQITELDEKMRGHMAKNGARTDGKYRAWKKERRALEELKTDAGSKPNYSIPWSVKPGSSVKRVQNIENLKSKYTQLVYVTETIRDEEKKEWVDAKNLNQKHYDKWFELDKHYRTGGK